MTVTYLDRIVARHREVAATDGRRLDDVIEVARRAAPPRPFRDALTGRPELAVIAEIKRRSPSKGALNVGLDPVAVAVAYAAGGAAALSVLTDEEFFSGSVRDLQTARDASGLPVLRKDFTVCALDVADARAMGADAVLLIAAALDRVEIIGFHHLAVELGLDVLVEIHDETELEVALECGATMIGVNQRDLVTFEVDHARAERMATAIPDGVVKVAESGVRDGGDARRLADAGYDAVLVGETLVTSPDPVGELASLRVMPSMR
ncbi:MAG: indole-3-glycerol phosphate synthase TrpC [Ilumatobacteraceae bacterium]